MTIEPHRVILNGTTDTSGHIEGEEQEHLAAGFGDTLKKTRISNGYSVDRVSDLAGISPRHWWFLEAGARRPSVDAIKAMARVLAPEVARDALEQRLAGLAGDSLREGKQREKRQAENKNRRDAARAVSKHHRDMRKRITDLEKSGRPVSEALRRFVNSDAVRETIKDFPPEEPGITGHTPVRVHQKTMAELLREAAKALK